MDAIPGVVAGQVMDAVAEMFKAMYPPEQTKDMERNGAGIRVKVTKRCWVHLNVQMFGDWLLTEVYPETEDKEDQYYPASGYRRGWLYSGPGAVVHAFDAALRWDGEPYTEPSGWAKAVHDGRRHGEQVKGLRQL